MASIREQILEQIVQRLADGTIGAGVYRSRTAAVSRGQTPAVIVRPASDGAAQTVMPKLQCTLQVQIEVITRGDAPDQLADPILVAMNSALMADITLGGLAIQTVPRSWRFHFHDGDESIGRVIAEYEIRYRSDERDLTLQ